MLILERSESVITLITLYSVNGLSTLRYGQVQIKCDEMPKNEVSQFIENLCPFCAAEFVDPKNVMVILLTHISFRKKND